MISTPETVQDAILDATHALGMTMPYHEARLQAELLMAHALGISRTSVLARLDEAIEPGAAALYAARVARRAQHEPLAYILGHQEFYGLDFVVDRRVLVPRHETEMLVQIALERARSFPSPVVVDVGTGSGALALAIAFHLPQARVFAFDASRDALDVARMNAERLRLSERVEFGLGSLLERFTGKFDVLVANLPYIPTARIDQLPREIHAFEPREALDGGEDGLEVVRQLLGQFKPHAASGGVMLLEISEEQGRSALDLTATVLPQAAATLHRDLEGLDRVIEIQ